MNKPSEPVIALVDDDQIFQLISRKIIEATQLSEKILQFHNGGEAIAYLKQYASDTDALPDVLFLDINMPIVDGWMFLEDYIELKASIQKPIRIYMVSSSIDPKDIERANSIKDIHEYVIKPISKDKFAELISRVA